METNILEGEKRIIAEEPRHAGQAALPQRNIQQYKPGVISETVPDRRRDSYR